MLRSVLLLRERPEDKREQRQSKDKVAGGLHGESGGRCICWWDVVTGVFSSYLDGDGLSSKKSTGFLARQLI